MFQLLQPFEVVRCYFIYPYLVDNKIYCTVKPWQCCTSLTELSDLNGSIVGVMSLKSFLSQSLHLLLLDAYSGLRTSRQTNGDNFQNYLLWWFLTMVRLLLHVKYDVLMSNIIWITIFNFVQYLELYTLIYVWVSGREVSSHCRVERTINTAGVSWSAPVYSCSESLITTPASCNQSPPGAVKHDG